MQTLHLRNTPLAWEETFLCDGFPVLHATVTLPVLADTGRNATRLNRYYHALFHRLRTTLSTRSRRQAEATFHTCQQRALPFSPWSEQVTYKVTLDACNLLSILVCRERQTEHATSVRLLGDVWRKPDGLPLSAWSFLSVSDRRALGELLHQHCPELPPRTLLRHFDPNCFYLTEAGLHLYFSAHLFPDFSAGPRILSLPIPACPVIFP